MPFFEIAQKWTERYAASKRSAVIPALRVEQGEYAIADHDTKIGTYNVRQCVVIHVLNPKNKKHGLIHIDGHTEMLSAKKFLQEMGNEDLQIRLFGGNSKDTMGLNDSAQNIEKVRLLLKSPEINKSLKNRNIDSIISQKDDTLIDFVVTSQGEAEKGMAEGIATGDTLALHTIQEIRRQDRYQGTYPAIQANVNEEQPIYLDERAILKLKEYKEGALKKAQELRDPLDSTDYTQYDASIEIILEKWRESREELLKNIESKRLDYESLKKTLEKIPMHIGKGSMKKNLSLAKDIEALPVGVDIEKSILNLEEV